MIEPIEPDLLARTVRRFNGRRVYLHLEVTPGGFLRNLAAQIDEVVVRSSGSTCRVALRCADDGWVVMEGLTHMALRDGEPLMLCTLEAEDRLTRVIQISEEAFPA